jgi:hypothetical protein
MKQYLVLSLLFFVAFTVKAQMPKRMAIEQQELLKFAESIHTYEHFEGSQLWAKIFTAHNGSGSANLPESHEVSYSLYICLAHYDEYPESKLYKLGPFKNPKVIKKVDSGSFVTFYISDGYQKDLKTYKIVVSETSLKIQN